MNVTLFEQECRPRLHSCSKSNYYKRVTNKRKSRMLGYKVIYSEYIHDKKYDNAIWTNNQAISLGNGITYHRPACNWALYERFTR